MDRKKNEDWPVYYGGDGPERINRCLACPKKKCTNCLVLVLNPEGRRKRSPKWATEPKG